MASKMNRNLKQVDTSTRTNESDKGGGKEHRLYVKDQSLEIFRKSFSFSIEEKNLTKNYHVSCTTYRKIINLCK